MLSDVAHIEALNILCGVFILPIAYFQDCADVHREYGRFYRDIAKVQCRPSSEMRERLEMVLHPFTLEHWYVMAVVTLLSAILIGADSLSLSKYLTIASDFDAAKKTVLIGGICFSAMLTYRIKHAKRSAFILMAEFSKNDFSNVVDAR